MLPTQPVPVSALAQRLACEFRGDASHLIDSVGSVTHATRSQITFVVDQRRANEILASDAGAVIVRAEDAGLITDRPVLIHDDPYYAYALLAQYFSPRPRARASVHASAVVEPSASVDPSAEIGPLVYIAPDAKIAAGVRIHAGVRIGRGSSVGADTEIFPNVVLYHGCQVGERCVLHAGVVLGADGFGYAPHKGQWTKIPQTGGVIIGNDVEIGANTTIDRGALDDTEIGDGVKLDNQIQIGHNCKIGAHTAIAGCVGIAGSTRIGKHCMIGGAAMLAGHFDICDNVVISAGTLIASDIKKPGRYTGVFPTVEHSLWRKMAVKIRKLSS
jgi:UDP-3-O-[3-hydroxymyristoyl] glucosamine N-acyltransferase